MQDALMKLATTPPLAIDQNAKVSDAVNKMVADGRGAIAVVDGETLVGIFTERDLLEKVIGCNLDPTATPVREAMETEPVSVVCGASRQDALALMLQGRFRHLPICDENKRPIAMLSFRDLLHHQISRLRGEVDSLEAYLLADGPGG